MGSESMAQGGFHTTTVIEASHPVAFPHALFEYQHATGATLLGALQSGFLHWASMDLVTLIDACAEQLSHCAALEVRYEASELLGQPDALHRGGLRRQILLGPMAHSQEHEPESLEEHEFCPCCLFTNCIAAFGDLLKGRDFLGVRLYASRNPDGLCEADCRVNGRDFEPALPLLRLYASQWPQAGMEFRKQYVVIRTLPAAMPRVPSSHRANGTWG